ncbi:tripartite tricarboxylate transporter TctB family protein [Sporosarcina sp. GW1-11]|uniref:tripartite tricarboxylate transporter TctB family protein n=1 Tax=Sporosarcina sp. GW1-11 TaxID=2899126 RepID=UPI00294FCC10|nr:tripartite tricarboxylate transporter TctB family protein [Sporosarcina sp. GW1-11]MDV6378726.1 tripartite tricarboxylate transporter TctB family protein [Sporosarcina sp. GW1-11]
MNSKVLSLVLLLATGLIGVIYYLSTNSLKNLSSSNAGEMGSGYFPRLLAIILIVLTIISIIQTLLEKESEKIDLGNWKMVVATLILTPIYIFLWVYVGYFYILTFIFLFGLIYIYQVDRKSKKMLIINAITTSVVLVAIYVFFGILLEITF